MLSTTSQYALRGLLVLASEPGDRLVPGRDISWQADIPANYLSKVMWTLAGAGMVEAVRGIKGGYRLRIPPGRIALIDVVRLFDRQFAPTACFLGVRSECSDCDPCTAHAAWQKTKAALIHFMERTTLHDLSAGGGLKTAGVVRRRVRR
jgi:Rrf2 family protein